MLNSWPGSNTTQVVIPDSMRKWLHFIFATCTLVALDAYDNDTDVGIVGKPTVRMLAHNVGTRHASVRLNYHPSSVEDVVSFYNQVVVSHSSEATYFAANRHAVGYMGIQQVEDRGFWFIGQAIFSIWDPGCEHLLDAEQCPNSDRVKVVKCGFSAVCSRFDGEGTGAKATVRVKNFGPDDTLAFLVTASELVSGKIRYDGYFHSNADGWELLAQIEIAATRPRSFSELRSFVEQWENVDGEKLRWGWFGPVFLEHKALLPVRTSWKQVTTASFHWRNGPNEDATHNDCRLSDDGRQWGLGIGGDLQRTADKSEMFTVASGQPWPSNLETYVKLREKGNLPGGCFGGTCFDTQVKRILADMFSKDYIGITICGFLAFLIVICAGSRWLWVRGWCCSCCGKPGESQAWISCPCCPRKV